MAVSPVLIERFNRMILRADSVSAALQDWCGDEIRSSKMEGVVKGATPDQRRRLGIGAQEPIGYRSVHLICRDIVITHAEIWYRPGCLTGEMREALEETDRPFGLVVEAMGQKRENFAVYELASPFILEHRAVLISRNGIPFGIAHERHTEAVLGFQGA